MNFITPSPLKLEDNLQENWRRFQQSFKIYMEACGHNKEKEITEARKVAILLNVVGEEALEVYNTFKVKEVTLENVLKEFENYCNPKKNILYSRYVFYARTQNEGETIQSFVTELKTLVKNCEFKDDEEMLRDKIVLTSNDRETQDRLIKMGSIKLDEAIEAFRVAEVAREQIKKMHSEERIDKVKVSQKHLNKMEENRREKYSEVVPKWTKNEKLFPRKKTCFRCGREAHRFEMCPAKGKICSKCNKYNHFAAFCKSVCHEIRESEYYCDSLTGNCKEWRRELEVANFKVNFKLDTGSDVNILPNSLLNKIKLCNKNCLRVNSTDIKLSAYGGFRINCLGQINLMVKYKRLEYLESFIIVEGDKMPILGRKTCLKFNLIRLVDNVQIKQGKNEMCRKYSDVFSGIGKFPKQYDIKIKDNVNPVCNPPTRLPIALQDKLKFELEMLTKKGIIEKAHNNSEWINKLVIVEKPNGTIRLCLNPKDLNDALKKDYYEIPTINDLKSKLQNAKYFSVVDLKDGFWQIPLSRKSKNYCTFSTKFGNYCFKRLPFGLSTSAEVFQKYNEEIFGDIPNVFVYIDDILVFGETNEEHDIALETVMKKARINNIKFNKDKFQYKSEQVKYLGFKFQYKTITPDESAIEAILNYDVPRNKKDLQRFLGLINYLRDFVPNLSKETVLIRELLKKDIEFVWLEKHSMQFIKLKEMISKQPTLKIFDRKKDIVIQTDSSKDGLGSVLLQDNQPVCYASKCLTETEQRYGQIEKEFLAILFSCKKFEQYIYGKKVTIQTDHLPLVSIMKKDINKIPSSRLQRIKLKLFKYNIEVIYKPGKTLLIADALSRACSKHRVTIRPGFCGTVPDFSPPSRIVKRPGNVPENKL